MFSVGDIYNRIKAFRRGFGPGRQTFYFAKVDVQAAFDTIPQEAIVELMKGIPSHGRYKIAKHVEIQAVENTLGHASDSRASSRWHSVASAAGNTGSFLQSAEGELGIKRKNTVFVDSIVQKSIDRESLMSLLASHVRQNLVKIGKKYYRQREGIPQGSVLSSTLCNYFYADLETRHLSFLQGDDCLLLRLIDDFLLITTSRGKATHFIQTMHQGFPEYGAMVNLGKSLVNFEMTTDGQKVPLFQGDAPFPYCGTLIDCHTLEVSKDRGKPKDSGRTSSGWRTLPSADPLKVIFNSLTVEFSRNSGLNFKRKILSKPS